MKYEESKGMAAFAGDGFAPDLISGGEAADFGEGAGQSEPGLWACAAGSPEAWLEGWEGRQETHDMFHNSYD